MSVLQLDRPHPQTRQSLALSEYFDCKTTTILIAIFRETLQHIFIKYTCCEWMTSHRQLVK